MSIIASYFANTKQGSGHSSNPSREDHSVGVKEVVAYCSDQLDQQIWLALSKRFRSVVQRAYVNDVDIEQKLASLDLDGDGFIR